MKFVCTTDMTDTILRALQDYFTHRKFKRSDNRIYTDAPNDEIDEMRLYALGYRHGINSEIAEITKLQNALKLIFEVHPTRNTKEAYAEAVREIAAQTLAATETLP